MRLLESLRGEFTSTQEQIRSLTDEIAAEDGAVATEEQAANLELLNGNLEALSPRIAQAAGMESRMSNAAELLAGVPSDLDARLRSVARQPISTAFDSVGDYARAIAAETVDSNVRDGIDRLRVSLETTVRARTFSRALADEVTSDVPGLLPPAWLTDIVDVIGRARPFVTAFDSRPLPPSGMTINFPQITQRPPIGKQSAEKTEVPSGKMTVGIGSTSVQTYGGGQDVSVQVLQRTEPSYLSLLLEVYAEEMSIDIDTAAIAAVETALTPHVLTNVVALGADPAAYNAKLAEAAHVVMTGRVVPNTLVMGLDIWEAFAGASDSEGRPLFPNVNASNPVGSSSLDSVSGEARGISWVVDPNMNPAVGYLGWDRAFTTMVSGMQTLSADNPAKLGRDYAVFEFVAFAVRRPLSIVKLTLP